MSEELVQKDYILNIKIPFKSIDDVQAREYAKTLYSVSNDSIVKLQEVFKDKTPRGVTLD